MRARAVLLAVGLAFAGGATAQQENPNVLVTATYLSTGPLGYDEVTKVTCRGTPTCSGTYSSTTRYENCTNHFTVTGAITVTGLNLAQSGPIQGTITFAPGFSDPVRLAGGICANGPTTPPETSTYTGAWNLATATGNITVTGANDTVQLTFKADVTAAPPVFPMVVRADIGPVTSTASADIQFRPQDVGRTGGVYVFASAPASQVRGGLEAKAVKLGVANITSKADPPPCVLAQLSPTGQLVAVTIAQLQAFVSGAFSAAGASVSILNNTPTPGVAGATFYVGYGSSASAMIDGGIFRNAVLIPGGACPLLPYQTALWWNPAESGWGLNLSHQGSLLFGTLFTYDAGRAPLWLVMSAGAMQSDGLSFAGELYRTTGPAFNANPFTPIGAGNVTNVGSMTLTFTDANAATLRYTMNGVEVTKSIQRQVYGARASICLPTTESRATSVNYQDLWWNPAESGWGLNVTHQDNTLFATLFTYDDAGRGLWLVMPSGARQADLSYLGDLYRTTGPPFNSAPFTPIGGADITMVGTMRLRFTDGNTGTLTYSYNGASVTKSISRQVFSTPQSLCQ